MPTLFPGKPISEAVVMLPEEPFTLLALRRRLGLTQKEMAERLGCQQSLVSRIELGARSPTKTMRLLIDSIRREVYGG